MFDSFFGLVFAVAVLGAIGSALWWVFVIWAGVRLFKAATGQIDGLLPQIEQQLRAYQNLPVQQRAGQTAQISTLMYKLNQGLRDIDAVSRARYETRVGEISSMAAQAGISFTPDRW